MYGDIAKVKEKCKIDTADYDNELETALEEASNYIDVRVGQYVNLPFVAVPNIINDIANDLAAAIWRENRAESESYDDKHIILFRSRAEASLSFYISLLEAKERKKGATLDRNESWSV